MKRKINGGLYLVVDPMPGLKEVLPKVNAALEGGVDSIQLWNHWNPNEDYEKFVLEICSLAHNHDVPVLINENWQWMKTLPLDGVHFDTIPLNVNQIKKEITRSFLIGITCSNDEDKINWAIENKIDYLSFCSVFPSSTSNSCELVRPETIQATRDQTNMLLYAAGGITFDNTSQLLDLGINGIAIVSGIMKAENPYLATRKFKQKLSDKITL